MPTPKQRGDGGAGASCGSRGPSAEKRGGRRGRSREGPPPTVGPRGSVGSEGRASRCNQLLGPARRGPSAARGRPSADGKTSSRLPGGGYSRHVVGGGIEHTSRRGRHRGFSRHEVLAAGPAAERCRSAPEGTQMGRGRAAVIVTAIFLASAVGAAVIIWQAKAHGVPLFYVLGTLMVAVGIGFSLLHLSVSDEYLRQHFGGGENA